MLSFILGAPQSGKTQETVKRISNDLNCGKDVLFIVPEQETLSVERRIIDSQLSSPNLFALEVVNFRRLSNVVFRQKGGLCYNYIENGGQAVIMWRVLSELSQSLHTYKIGESTDIGLVSSLVCLFSQFYDYRISALDFENAVSLLSDSNKAKAEDLSTIYTRFDELVHKDFDSPKDDLFKVAEIIEKYKLFSDTKVYIDSFSGFTPAEFNVIRALISVGADVCVSLCIDPYRDKELFSNLYDVKKIISDFATDSFCEITDDHICSSLKYGEFAFFEKYAYNDESDECYPVIPENISFLTAPDIYTECELICADIVKQIKNKMRYRDICIVADNIKDYCGILDVMMQRHGISFRITDNRDILQSPCVKFIISALNIIIYNWQFDDVISYIKSGFCSCSDEECDIIEEYASTWSLSGSVWKTDEDWNMNPQGYSSYINDQTFAFLEKINNIRDRIREPVINLSLSLKDNRTGKNTAEAIYRFLTDSIDPSQLKGDDISSWNAVVFALEQLALCAGDEKINDIETLKRLLRLICSQTSFSMLPSTIDEISVVSIGNLRSVDAKRIYIIGANEGSYPADYKESNILDDMLCEELRKNGLTLMHDPQEMLNEQKWLFYKTILSAKESVVVSYHTGTLAGKELLQSNAVTEIQRLFPQISSVNYKDLCITDLVYDKPSAFDYADDEEYGNLIKEVLLCDESYKNSIEGFDTPISTNECSIKDPSNLSSYNGNMSMTQSKLEKFVKCRFSYRMTYDLCLKEQQKVNYDPRDIGNFIHKVLEDFFKAASQNKLDSKSRKELVDKIVDRYIADTCGNMKFVSKRLIALFEKLRRNAHIFVRSIYEEFEDSEFVPSFFEMDVSFGEDSDISPYKIKLSDGTQLYIKGKIDRVDTFEKNGKVYFRVVDYKTGKKDFKVSDLEKGINLQMFLYMFSIMENKEKFLELINKKGELIPSGVIYYIAKILPETYNEIMPQSMIENDIITGIERQGMILSEDTLVDAMSKSGYKYILPKGIDIEKGKGPLYTLESLGAIQGKINDVVNKIALEIKQGMASAWPCEFDPMCEYCSHYNICRINKEGEGDDE